MEQRAAILIPLPKLYLTPPLSLTDITTLVFLSIHIFKVILPSWLVEAILPSSPRFYLKCVPKHSSFSSKIGLFQTEAPRASGYTFEKRQSWATTKYVKPHTVWYTLHGL